MSLLNQISFLVNQLHLAKISATLFYGWVFNNPEVQLDLNELINNYNPDLDKDKKFSTLDYFWVDYLHTTYCKELGTLKDRVSDELNTSDFYLSEFGSPSQPKYFLAHQESIYQLDNLKSDSLLSNLDSKLLLRLENDCADFARINQIKKLYVDEQASWHLVGWNSL